MITKLYGPARARALKDAWEDTQDWAREVHLPVVLLVTDAPLVAVAMLGGSRLVGQLAQALYLLVALYGHPGAPSLGVLTLNALCAASEVFIPLQPHFLALHGLSKLLETTALVSKRINPQLRVSHPSFGGGQHSRCETPAAVLDGLGP